MAVESSENFSAERCDWLILTPTEFELGFVQKELAQIPHARLEKCGFGAVVPAAKTVQLVQKYSPRRVLLLGIAGSYDPQLEVGSAIMFGKVSCYGIGVGTGKAFQSAREMGWFQWSDSDENGSIGDSIHLKTDDNVASSHLLTVCSASDNLEDVEYRRAAFPDALAEDMEGFSVAAACQLCDVTVSIIRGISNQAGDRDKTNWKIGQAMVSALQVCLEITQTSA